MESIPETHLQKLVQRRAELLTEMEALRNKISGLDIAVALLNSGWVTPDGDEAYAGKVNTTETIMGLLQKSGGTGLNAQTAVALAAGEGLSLNKGSVSSLLSRLKRDGIVIYENARYKLKEYARRGERSSNSMVPIADEESSRHH